MHVTLELPSGFCQGAGSPHRAAWVGRTVLEALEDLARECPTLEPHLAFGPHRGPISRVFLNDRLLRGVARMKTVLDAGDVLTVVPPPGARMEAVSPELSVDERMRYARHLSLPEVGEEGQRRLKGSSVLVVGAGGLGSPLALYLAAAGVGKLGLVDFDIVDPSDLHRQILHGTRDLGKTKIESGVARILDLNPHIDVRGHATRLGPDNVMRIIRDYDVVADATDNFPTRYLLNDACVLLGRPNVYGSVFQFEGQITVFGAPGGPCYRCIYPEPPPPGMIRTCVDGGVLGIVPGVLGLLQATEIVKFLLGLPHLLVGKLVTFDALRLQFRESSIRPDPSCPCCGEFPKIDSLVDHEGSCPAP